MSHKENENWDMCWSYLSSAGCRNSQCRWRHGNPSAGQYQNRGTKSRANANLYRELSGGLSRELPNARFYPLRQHNDGGVEDEHGLVHYPDTRYNYVLRNNPLLNKCADSSGSEHFRYSLSTINVSSTGKNLVYSPMSPSMITSDDGIISNSDLVKNAMFKKSGMRGKTRDIKVSPFSQGAFQGVSSKGQMKVENCNHDANASMAVVNTAVKQRTAQKKTIYPFTEGALREFLAPAVPFKVEAYPLQQIQEPFLYIYK